MLERDILYKRAVLDKREGAWDEYKIKRNLIVHKIREEKEKYYKECIDVKTLLPNKKTNDI